MQNSKFVSNNHKTISNKKDMNNLSPSFRSLMDLNQDSFLYSLFNVLMTKTSYGQLENFERIEKKIEKSSVNPIVAFDHKYMM